ncbi:MAG: corrinoid protein [Acidimicrobiia bacterium]|nr:corrinoid protein [Acidimicrobiia bacterium]
MSSREDILARIHDCVLDGDPTGATEGTRAGLEADIEAMALVYESMVPALREVGRRFEAGEYFLPEMLMSANAMQACMDLVRPLLADSARKPIGTFVMGTVAGDIHDIGKNLCNAMLESTGFKVIDLGVNVPADAFVEAITAHEPDAVGMSAFLTTTMREIGRNIGAIEDAGLRDRVKILVGGALLDQAYADEVGADGYAPDANSAARLTKEVLGIDD